MDTFIGDLTRINYVETTFLMLKAFVTTPRIEEDDT